MSDFVLLCDQVIRDEQTRKYSLIGLFDRVHATRFPAQLRPFFLFCELSEVRAFDHEIALRDGERDLFSGRIEGSGAIPAGLSPDIHLSLPVPPLTVAREGPLYVEIRRGGDTVARATLVVDAPPAPKFRDLSAEEIGRILADPDAAKSVVGEFACHGCGAAARYGLSIDPYATLPEGVRPFPVSLMHGCEKCSAREWLAPMKADLLNRLGRKREEGGRG